MRNQDLGEAACELILLGLVLAYLAFAYSTVEYQLPYFPVCPWFVVTSRPCLLCGSTRYVGQYLHGWWEMSWAHLPSLVWFGFVVGVGILSAGRTLCHVWRLCGRGKRATANELPIMR